VHWMHGGIDLKGLPRTAWESHMDYSGADVVVDEMRGSEDQKHDARRLMQGGPRATACRGSCI
jgi:hypothetical protein